MGAILEYSPQIIKKILILFESILGGAVMAAFAYMAAMYTIKLMHLGRMSVALNWPMWIFAMWLILGFGLSAIHYVRLFSKNVKEKEVWQSPEERFGLT